ncbi:MAG: hypothetical protein A07HR60_02785 [uncultured archaeon A07HR60]|nr:MAG: hypothetical protein A07HR60_02785 [uncultured archaeon A07HR60]
MPVSSATDTAPSLTTQDVSTVLPATTHQYGCDFVFAVQIGLDRRYKPTTLGLNSGVSTEYALCSERGSWLSHETTPDPQVECPRLRIY